MLYSNDELRDIEAHEKYWLYAEAFRAAGERQCAALKSSEEIFGYGDAAVCLHLARHATELFLKGMLVSRTGSCGTEHYIGALKDSYFREFPEEVFRWDVPFSDTQHSRREAKKNGLIPPDQLLRYPTKKDDEDWPLHVSALETDSFLAGLIDLKYDFSRLITVERNRRTRSIGSE